MSQSSILAVDDDPLTLKFLEKVLLLAGYQVVATETPTEALEQVRAHRFDLALLDLRLPEMSGIEVLRQIKKHDDSIEIVMATGYPEVKTAIEALKEGAFDYLTKPLNLDELRMCLARALERRFLRGWNGASKGGRSFPSMDGELVGASPQMMRLNQMIAQVAASESAVLILGESGTGKELVAAGVHRLSSRNGQSFIPVNCAAIPPGLLESELFGHARGSFSGAVTDRLGLFRSAQGGTLFLDEIAELPWAVQSKLLRVLQDKEVRPVGSNKSYQVDVRIIAATNRDMDEALATSGFREDLFYRLNVLQVEIPPLRERKEDIPPLVSHFIKRLNQGSGRKVDGIEPEALAALLDFDFPGNVRQLENLIERAHVLGTGTRLRAEDFPVLTPSDSPVSGALPPDDSSFPTLAEAERDLIQKALRWHRGDRKKAAQALGLSPRTLYRRLREFNQS
jgi:DNA-binding NtrC family response regulator